MDRRLDRGTEGGKGVGEEKRVGIEKGKERGREGGT